MTPDAVGKGRPHPWMIFENMRQLDVYPPAAIVKVGDTVSDIDEARNAGVISVGVCESSNEAVLLGAEYARTLLESAGARRVIPTSPDLWQILEEFS